MTKSCPSPAERAFTLIELLVVIAGIFILAGFAVPAFHRAFERAKVLKDMSNLRQIGAATQLYMNDNNGAFPGSATSTWMLQLEQNQKYLSVWRVLESPFDTRTSDELGGANTAVSYGINANVYDVNNAAISADKDYQACDFYSVCARAGFDRDCHLHRYSGPNGCPRRKGSS